MILCHAVVVVVVVVVMVTESLLWHAGYELINFLVYILISAWND